MINNYVIVSNDKVNIDLNIQNIIKKINIKDLEIVKCDYPDITINSVLENVDYVNESRDNELEVFMQIYVMLGKLIKYDQEINELDNRKNKDFYLAHNLIGGLLKRTVFM